MAPRRCVGSIVIAVLVAACSGSDAAPSASAPASASGESTAPRATATSVPSEPSSDAQPVDSAAPDGDDGSVDERPIDQPIGAEIQPGVEQITLLDATPGSDYDIVDAADPSIAPIASGTADDYGSLVFRELDAASDYRVGDDEGFTTSVDVLDRDEHPDASFYGGQRLPIDSGDNSGFGYIETRDGTTLSAYVVLPGPVDGGPYPTVVEYSGYSPSDPGQGPGFASLFSALGYAYVGVNIRGTGCSGGSFRYFEYTQSTDGYDVIETVAAQPWVDGNAVGMVGISYPGISQLFVAQTQPPSLKAITPLSVLDDSYRATLYPGGILNTGFAVDWTQDRVDSAQPSIDPDGEPTDAGQAWSFDRIAAGDVECATNQRVRQQNPDLVAEVFDNPYYDPAVSDELSPRLFVDRIEVPTFVAGAWQDEQTGGRFPTMLDAFTGTDHLYATLVNGLHTESISPAVLPRLVEFLDLYVAERTPDLAPARAVAPVLANGIWGTDEIGELADRFAGMDYPDALAAFEAEAPIEVLFEQGAADGASPLTPLDRFSERFERWPIPATAARVWHLSPDRLVDEPPASHTRVEYVADPANAPATFWSGNSSDLWRTDVTWDWPQPAADTFVDFRSEPLAETLTMVGSASADLWIVSEVGDTDVEVTLSELRPDGTEVLVQSGWLRASHRALDESLSTDLRPVHTHLESDAEPLPDPGGDGDGTQVGTDAFALVRVEIFPFAHVFRAGSQIRLMVDAPGGNRAVWEFDTISGGELVQVGFGPPTPSQLVLPVIPGIEPPPELPACDSLRGQPCRR